MLRSQPAAPAFALPIVIAACLIAAPSCGQNLIGKLNQRMAAQPDPAAMIRDSARFAGDADNLSINLVGTVSVVAGESNHSSQEVFSIQMSKPRRYAIDMLKPNPEFWVRSNGEQTMTYVAPLGRYSLTSDAGGISDFADTRIAKLMGNGVGGLVFSLLGTASAEEVIESTSESEYLGEEIIDEAPTHHCRFKTGGLSWEAWFSQGDAPLVRRVRPDLSEMATNAPAAAQFDNFSFDLTFDFRDVDTTTAIPAEAFALDAPPNAELVDNLFAPPEQPPHALLGQEAPVFDALDPAGEPIDLGSLIGQKVIILDFWATWCGPCIAALPQVKEVANDYKDKGVAFFAVNQGEDVETVQQFLTNQDLALPVAMDQDGAVGSEYRIEGLPTSFLIGKDGKVQVVHVGFSSDLKKTLTGELDELLAGKDLAAEKLEAWAEKQARKRARQAAAEAEQSAAETGVAGGE